MRKIQSLIAALGLIAANPNIAAASSENSNSISYQCSDILVVGSIQNVNDSYRGVEIEDDILGHGWMTARIRIKRVLHGKASRSVVSARYFGHAYRVFDLGKSYVVVLRPASDGSYTATTIRRWNMSSKTNVARACT